MWSPFNFAAGPCISSQAVILTNFRLISSLEKLHSHETIFPAWERAFPREKKRCLRPRNAGLQKRRAMRTAFPPI